MQTSRRNVWYLAVDGIHDKEGNLLVTMRLVIVESPFRGDVEANTLYARDCLNDCLHRGEAPIASHLLFTQPGVLRDDVPGERTLGIEAGLAWHRVADRICFYTDRGWSRGMRNAEARALAEKKTIEHRSIPSWREAA